MTTTRATSSTPPPFAARLPSFLPRPPGFAPAAPPCLFLRLIGFSFMATPRAGQPSRTRRDVRRGRLSPPAGEQRQHDGEAPPAPLGVGGLGAPAVGVHDPGDDRQAEPGARAPAPAPGVRAPE